MKAPIIKPKATIWLSMKTNYWRTMDDVRRACAGKPVRITGTTLNLQGVQICGTKLPKPKSSDSEDSEPLRINIPGFTLLNGSVRGIPGGILGREPKHTYLDLVFLETGEDALSNIMDDSPDWTIDRCKFFGASDKSVQMNDARGLTMIHSLVAGGVTGCRIQKKATKYDNIKTKLIGQNTFVDLDTAWNLSGPVFVAASANRYENVRLPWKPSNGAKYKETK